MASFRFHSGRGASDKGWCFDYGRDVGYPLSNELTNGALRLDKFDLEVPVIGHFKKGNMYFVVYKPSGAMEIRGKRLSCYEYENYQYNPFVVASEALKATIPRAGSALINYSRLATEPAYLGRARELFVNLPDDRRQSDYMSIFPRNTARNLFPETYFEPRELQGAPPRRVIKSNRKELGHLVSPPIRGESVPPKGRNGTFGDKSRKISKTEVDESNEDENKKVQALAVAKSKSSDSLSTFSIPIIQWVPAIFATVLFFVSYVFLLNNVAGGFDAAATRLEELADSLGRISGQQTAVASDLGNAASGFDAAATRLEELADSLGGISGQQTAVASDLGNAASGFDAAATRLEELAGSLGGISGQQTAVASDLGNAASGFDAAATRLEELAGSLGGISGQQTAVASDLRNAASGFDAAATRLEELAGSLGGISGQQTAVASDLRNAASRFAAAATRLEELAGNLGIETADSLNEEGITPANHPR